MCEGESCYYPSKNEFFYQVIRLERHEKEKKNTYVVMVSKFSTF